MLLYKRKSPNLLNFESWQRLLWQGQTKWFCESNTVHGPDVYAPELGVWLVNEHVRMQAQVQWAQSSVCLHRQDITTVWNSKGKLEASVEGIF